MREVRMRFPSVFQTSILVFLMTTQALTFTSGIAPHLSTTAKFDPFFAQPEVDANFTLSQKMSLTLTDVHLSLNGSIELKDYSQLVIKRSTIAISGVELFDESHLIIEDSNATIEAVTAHQRSDIILKDSFIRSLFYGFDDSQISAYNSTITTDGYTASRFILVNTTLDLGLFWSSDWLIATNSKIIVKTLTPGLTVEPNIQHFQNCNHSSIFLAQNPNGSLSQHDYSSWVQNDAYSLNLSLSADNAPMPGAEVVFYKNGTDDVAKISQTDGSGNLNVSLDEGTYDVEALPGGGGLAHVGIINLNRCTSLDDSVKTDFGLVFTRIWTEVGAALVLCVSLGAQLVRRRLTKAG